ncbi:MAG: hypothetical protein JWL87_550 [Candidatus Adlerbacteria bacterium]|nr:hypothetical protein [Candidatus Adlerbacteria bacterium]
MSTGVLPIQALRKILQSGFIEGVSEEYLNPASLDLPCSAEAYRLVRSFFPDKNGTVRAKIREFGGTPHDLSSPLEVGVTYLIRIEGKFRLPPSVYAYANPKSSTGRLFVLTRVVADRVTMYDALTGPGWKGEVWISVKPEAFPVVVSPGVALSQIRLFDGKAFLEKLELDLLLESPGLFFDPSGKKLCRGEVAYQADSFLLTIGLPRGVAGWECSRVNEVLDLSRKNHYDPADFFRPVRMRRGRLDLLRGNRYILTTHEHLRLPPDCAAELRAIDPRFGDFRSHGAGFFDPGWGLKAKGQPITLEITPYEDMTVEHGQTIARVRYEHMKDVPEVLYGSGAARSSYKSQLKGAKLSKHFKK